MMTRKFRCDSCEKPFFENELIPIKVKGTIWFRCKDCRKKWGDKPRSVGYYPYLQTKNVFGGLEDEGNIIRFNP